MGNNLIKGIAILLLTSLLVACNSDPPDKGVGDTENRGSDNTESEKMEKISESVKMRAVIKEIGEKIEVEVTESEYTFGIHWVITHSSTAYYGKAGESITRSDLNVGDTVEILYSGQVMLSYPPQIVAAKITVV